MEDKLEYRMYGLVPYNISPIQQGIQFGHAVVEYMINFPVDLKIYSDTKKWATEDKTFIILNGGTTNKNRELGTGISVGSLNQHYDKLSEKGLKVASFYEPDLGDQLTAVVFLVDERVWNYEKYPERDINPSPNSVEISEGVYMTPAVHLNPESKENYEKRLGGPQNVWLREFLKQFRLA